MEGGSIGVRAGGGELGVDVGELALDELVVGDRGGELDSAVGIGKDEVEDGLHYSWWGSVR